MRAALLTEIPAATLHVEDLDEPQPEPGELLLEVLACGICGTDLHILDGSSYRPKLPFVLGHEPVGRVLAASSTEDDAWVGRLVTLTLFVGCGTCPACRNGDERLCADLRGISGVLHLRGGFAERMVVQVSQALPLPAGIGVIEAASLVDAGATAANSVRIALQTDWDGSAVVVGGGPVGFFVAELLRHAGRRLIVVQPSPARRATLENLGHTVVASLDEIMEQPSVVIDCAAAPGIVPWALERLVPRGVLIAAAYGPTDGYSLATLSRKELSIRGVRSGTRADLQRVVELAAAGAIRIPPISSWPLDEINDAITALREKRVPGKAVVVPTP